MQNKEASVFVGANYQQVYNTLLVGFVLAVYLLLGQVQALVLTHPSLYSLRPGYLKHCLIPYTPADH